MQKRKERRKRGGRRIKDIDIFKILRSGYYKKSSKIILGVQHAKS